jgi:hypothetical protein
MAIQITINSVTSGLSPYNVYVCDQCFGGTCQYIDTFSDAILPFSFNLPTSFETYTSYVVKLEDSNGCVYCETSASSAKQFQDGEYFEFMDGEEYLFE